LTTPHRIQLSRTKGWRKPEGAVVVARPTRWGNPFTIAGAMERGWASDEPSGRRFVVGCFRDVLTRGRDSDWWFADGADRIDWIREHVRELAGRDLACWCPLDAPCHADVLLELANGSSP
jgi:hypothetical protein